MHSLTWRCDGSEGPKWYLRAIRDDGSFYGEVRYQTERAEHRWATFVSGELLSAERERLVELFEVFRAAVPPDEPGPHFGALFERLSPTNAGVVRRLFEYRLGDEAASPLARTFLDLVGLFEKHLVGAYRPLIRCSEK